MEVMQTLGCVTLALIHTIQEEAKDLEFGRDGVQSS